MCMSKLSRPSSILPAFRRLVRRMWRERFSTGDGGHRRKHNTMPKASRVLAAIKRDGRVETRRAGSHRRSKKGTSGRTWAYHDGADLGAGAMAKIAKDFGYTLDRLRRL